MKFSLFVNDAPNNSIERSPALQTAQAIQASSHDLYRVFFYAEGVQHSIGDLNSGSNPWQELAEGSSTDLCFCSGSLNKHGLTLSEHSNISIGGLVQLLDAQVNSDRIVSLN